ncbi:hypothetical protein F5141DRAFT_999894, partial [Pisolithus sp. B1]
GDDLKHMFTVKIALSESVSTLKKVIKDENQHTFSRVDVIELELYHTSEKAAGWSDNDNDDGLTQALYDGGHSPLFLQSSSAPQATISLNCLILGNSQDHIFPVEISSLKTVGALREVIKDKKQHTFRHVEADKLSLYCTSLPDNSKLEDMLQSFHFNEPLQAMLILAKIFTELPLEEHLHIVVQPPHEGRLSTSASDSTLILDHDLVLENASIDEGYKDILVELYDCDDWHSTHFILMINLDSFQLYHHTNEKAPI